MVNPEKILAPGAKSVVQSENIFNPSSSIGDDVLVPPGEENSYDSIAAPDEDQPIVVPTPAYFSVPPPNMLIPQEDPEYLKSVAAFLSRTEKKIDEHLDVTKAKRKRRTFTEYPVYDDHAPSSGKVSITG